MPFIIEDKKQEPVKGRFIIEDKEVPQDMLSQAARGVAQGATDVGMMGDLPRLALQSQYAPLYGGVLGELMARLGRSTEGVVATPGMEARAQQEVSPDLSDLEFARQVGLEEDLMPMDLLTGQRSAARQTAEQIPEGGELQEAVRRSTRTLPFAALGGPIAEAMGLSEMAGQAGAYAARKAGFGPGVELAADIGAGFLAPESIITRGSRVSRTAQAPAAIEEAGSKIAKAEILSNPKRFQREVQKLSEQQISAYENMIGDQARASFGELPSINARDIERAVVQETKDRIFRSVVDELPTNEEAWTRVQQGVFDELEAARNAYRADYKVALKGAEKVKATTENTARALDSLEETIGRLATKTPGQGAVESAWAALKKDLQLTSGANAKQTVTKLLERTGEGLTSAEQAALRGEKALTVDTLMNLKPKINSIIDYEQLDRSVKDLLRPVVEAMKEDINKSLNAAPVIKNRWRRAEDKYRQTANTFGKAPVEALRRADVPEGVASQFLSGSAAKQLKASLEGSPQTWSYVEQQMLKAIDGMSQEKASAAIRELSPHLSKEGRLAAQDIARMGDRLTDAGSLNRARTEMLADLQKSFSQGTRPDYALNMMRHPQQYKTVKDALARSPKGKKAWEGLLKQSVEDIFESLKDTNGAINWRKARAVASDPHIQRIIRDAAGPEGLAFFKNLERYGRNISTNMEQFMSKAPASLMEKVVSKGGLAFKSVLASLVGKPAVIAYLGYKTIPTLSKGIYYRMLASPRMRSAIETLSKPTSWSLGRIESSIQKADAAFNSGAGRQESQIPDR